MVLEAKSGELKKFFFNPFTSISYLIIFALTVSGYRE
jgi:hypothetical protein